MEENTNLLDFFRVREKSSFKILVASDIHLGYHDNNSTTRENDSFITFEEILQIGRDDKVDFLLLGGDLFHENRPKPDCIRKTISAMSKYCLGSKPIEFQYLGDPAIDFPNQSEPELNCQNPNINIAMPIFSIHGNHDDPIGSKKTSALDLLVEAKLLNHFGQWNNLNEITISPVLLVKGETKLALYGLGNIRDRRLFNLLTDKKVTFLRPQENQADWFNIFVLHQNRVKHDAKNYIPESYLPGFIDLVIWGHEHECRIDPEHAESNTKTFIIQPGSSIRTSLSAGEAVEKYVGILHINQRKFKLEKKKLRTVRPFILADIQLHDAISNLTDDDSMLSNIAEAFVEERVKKLVQTAQNLLTGHEKQPILPLIRVRVFHQFHQIHLFNQVRFSCKFEGLIANEDIILFKKKKLDRMETNDLDLTDMDGLFRFLLEPGLSTHIEQVVETFFKLARENGDTDNILELLPEQALSDAVKSYVETTDQGALTVVIKAQTKSATNYLMSRNVTSQNISTELARFTGLRVRTAHQQSAQESQPGRSNNDTPGTIECEGSNVENNIASALADNEENGGSMMDTDQQIS